jgi:hypothetical protein
MFYFHKNHAVAPSVECERDGDQWGTCFLMGLYIVAVRNGGVWGTPNCTPRGLILACTRGSGRDYIEQQLTYIY